MPPYPRVISEDETIDAAREGFSLARFGDGELRLAIGGNCISQRENSPRLIAELKAMLQMPPTGCIVCIPNVHSATPKADSWARYADSKFTSLYNGVAHVVYGSSFITRPDSAPWIDRPDYWDKVEQLWKGKEITLVTGDEKSLTTERCASAAKINVVRGPRINAYAEIDRIEAEILQQPAGPVLMCLGVTATVLAARLAEKGVHALDLGHIGMFRRHAGAYRYVIDNLVSPHYRATLTAMHQRQRWGADGHKHAEAVRGLIEEVRPSTILDYGCGRGELAKALAPIRVSEYDPAIAGKDGMPKPCELVVCTDVLEHIEPDRIDAVLDHLAVLAGRALYLVIATRPANAVLPDGRNAHLIVEGAEFWIAKLKAMPFGKIVVQGKGERELRVSLFK
ncbi:GT-D fold domain-containing glycosyltransferase [Bradyrhizobium sp. JYMT SZCCT0428]|uniref:GT-D fold domain-containing glycosyltransferase n=1 Tax=Bradyrhizobium sp. JYMT SZCCT0428 TaxID=2807673 RepID=UPI001BAB5FD0|nr:GT-D fold domain-containing glycosyltransferase [Bradyrhizobium sp. JYMT SZCCT0428]MBR1150092.1 DUF1792 domain-containing protein [Bradyrhizobium sp. JYMT SZCCT0428]